MPYSVTSWFVDQCLAKNAKPVRVFTWGGSDYSNYVSKWPTYKLAYASPLPGNMTVELANENGEFNILRGNKAILQHSAVLKMGFTHPDSGDELINLFTGTARGADFSGGGLRLSLEDKRKTLTEKVLGSSDSHYTFFTTSNFVPTYVLWTAITSGEGLGGNDTSIAGAGLSDVQSTSNTDIDYQALLDLSAVFSDNSVYINAVFNGVGVAEVVNKIGRITDVYAYVMNDLLTFKRFAASDEPVLTLGLDRYKRASMRISDEMVNRQYVYGGYAPNSRYWTITCVSTYAASINSFGFREDVEKDSVAWHITSTSCINLAERRTTYYGTPREEFSMEGTLVPLFLTIGDTVRFYEPSLDVSSGETWRVLGTEINMDTGASRLLASGYELLQPFILDDATNGLLDQSYNYLL